MISVIEGAHDREINAQVLTDGEEVVHVTVLTDSVGEEEAPAAAEVVVAVAVIGLIGHLTDPQVLTDAEVLQLVSPADVCRDRNAEMCE